MQMTELFLAELQREAARSKSVLEQVPEGRRSFKPHEKSMEFGYLSELVAMILSWIGYAVTRDELDIAPKEGPKYKPEPMNTAAELVAGLDKAVAQAREALQQTSDEFLETKWKLLVGGNVVMELPRHLVIRDTFSHSAHHRGQMTVYLRMLDRKVPAVYGPSADDRRFA